MLSFAMLFLVLAVLPLLVGIVLVVLSRRRKGGYPACGGCGYDVRGATEGAMTCPECGSDFKEVGITAPGRGEGRNQAMFIVGLLLIAAPLCIGSGAVAFLFARG